MLKIVTSIFCIVTTIGGAFADSVVATRTIRSQAILDYSDIAVIPDNKLQLVALEDLVGKEARVVLYQGRIINPSDVVRPAIIERNQIVKLNFRIGGLKISVDGRALGRASIGDQIRVMNLASKSAVMGFVSADGSVSISRSN